MLGVMATLLGTWLRGVYDLPIFSKLTSHDKIYNTVCNKKGPYRENKSC